MNAANWVLSLLLVAACESPEDQFCPRIMEFYMGLTEAEVEWVEAHLSREGRKAFISFTNECSGYS
jgi:hypothetical protein